MPVGEGEGRTTLVNVVEESDRAMVPTKGPNKGGRPLAEDLEGRARTKENVGVPGAVRTQRRVAVSQGLGGVR